MNTAIELRLRNRRGEWRDVCCHAEVAWCRSHDKGVHVVGVIMDLTEQRQMEEQFRQAQKMEAVGRLAGGVAHDFNNVLTVILNCGDFVLQGLEPDSAAHDDMQEIIKAAGRAEKLTSQLLAFSRRQSVNPAVLNLNHVLKELEVLLRRLLGEDIEIETDLAPDLWNVHVDSGGIEQVIMNMAINARDAMPSGGKLVIRTRNRYFEDSNLNPESSQCLVGPHVEISISDTGRGMDDETRRRLFEPFFTTKERGRGTGLGLATCYGIVQRGHGVIRVESEPGVGSTFRVLLPRHRGLVIQSPAPTVRTEKRKGAEVILVVEDEEPVRMLINRVLSQLGYTVLQAADGLDALEVARNSSKPIDLVLSDVVMPKLSGADLMQQLLELYPGIKVLLMSGYPDSDLKPGSDLALLQKPFSAQVLADRLGQVLSEAT